MPRKSMDGQSVAGSVSTSNLFHFARNRVASVERRLAVPNRLRDRWTEKDEAILFDSQNEAHHTFRLNRFRTEVIPWLDRTSPLNGARILEIGSGEGASTVALAEQGANVVGLDVDEDEVATARLRCQAHKVDADFEVGNAVNLKSSAEAHKADWIIMWAVLEHMTDEERLASIAAAWDALPENGLLSVVETPNRLWYFDSHTGQLPFYHWLPDSLAYRYAKYSPRESFRHGYPEVTPSEEQQLSFRRRGRGISFHEFEVAIERSAATLPVASCMQLERRRFNPARATGWAISGAGRYERSIRAIAPNIPRAWFQPFLYLTLRKA